MAFEFNELNTQLLQPHHYYCGITVYCQYWISRCRCLTRARTLCLCNSLPIQSYPIEEITDIIRQAGDPRELDALREQLNEAIKILDVQQEVMRRTMGPQSDAAFDAAEKDLAQQLEMLRKQREEFRRGSAGQGGGQTGGQGGGRVSKK